MDAFQANITATCPLAFGGTTGSLFANAVAALVAAHCAIFDDYRWPRDHANDIILRAADGVSYDFIIVGAGTAGSLVAGRLAQLYPSLSVLLVEAGDDPGLESEIPAFLFLGQDTDVDWHYNTLPDGKSCLGFKNNSCVWSKGKSLGGSSSINAMIYVRGHPEDFDIWEKAGNPGWGYENLKKYFEKVENDFKLYNYQYHKSPWYSVIEDAWKELGFAHNRGSEEATIGTQITKLLTRNGKRLNTAKMYLNELKNMHVMKNTIVQKVIIDKETRTTTGIEIRHISGIVMNMNAAKEVILSAGSIATPQILMLSGIGPRVHLEVNKIDCLSDLPVGQNLQDHVYVPLFLKANHNTAVSSEAINLLFLQYMLTKTGPLTNIGITDFMAFVNSKNIDYPNIQFYHTYFTKNDNIMLKPCFEGIGYRKEIIELIEKLNQESDLLGISPTLLHPKSQGEILLADINPMSKPVIKANYFDDHSDLETYFKGIEFVQKLQNTSIFKTLGIGKVIELDIPACKPGTEEYWECYIRHMATTIYHPVGTAKMGPRSDKTAVVDHNLSVHGVKKLRVVDASIMPTIPSSNTMASTLAIAEKAVDIIKGQYAIKYEL